MQEIGIDTALLNDILSGTKTIEGRLGKPRFLKWRAGDSISLRKDVWEQGRIDHSVHNYGVIKIKQLLHFESFDEMFRAVNFKAVIPAAKTTAEAISTYRRYYSTEDEQKYGVVTIVFELVGAKLVH
jgi:ASC-1-like (ASCH) protein